MEKKDFFVALGQALFAVMGACVKWLNAKDKRRQRLFSLASEAVSAAFAGFLVYCMYEWLSMNIYVAFAIAGVIGNQGAKGIDLIGRVIVKNSNIKGLDDSGKDE